MSRHAPILGLGGPLVDHRHVDQAARPASVRAATRFAASATGPQPGQVAGQPTEVGPVNRLVNGLVYQLAVRVVGELALQLVADLLRAPPFLQPRLHELPQHRIAGQLAPPGASAPARGQTLGGERPVLPTCPITVATYLPADPRRAAPQDNRDRANRLTASRKVSDHDPLVL